MGQHLNYLASLGKFKNPNFHLRFVVRANLSYYQMRFHRFLSRIRQKTAGPDKDSVFRDFDRLQTDARVAQQGTGRKCQINLRDLIVYDGANLANLGVPEIG